MDRPNEKNNHTDTVSRLLKSLVDHYIQPIHSIATSESVDFCNVNSSCSDRPFAPFVQAVQQQVLQHESCANSAALRLLKLYKSHVRGALYVARESQSSMEKRFTKSGIPVICHYEQLIASLTNDTSADQRLCIKTSVDRASLSTLEESLLCLVNDITAIQNPLAVEEEDDRQDAEVRPDTNHLRRSILRPFLQLLCYMLQQLCTGYYPNIRTETLRRCFISLLAFCAPRSYEHMDRDILKEIFDLRQYINVSLLQDEIAMAPAEDIWRVLSQNDQCTKLNERYDPVAQQLGINALLLLDKVVSRSAPQQGTIFLIQVVDESADELPEPVKACQRLIRLLGGSASVARDVRAHFFGRDILPEDEVIPKTRQRLHLGKTITETPPKEYKHFKSNPSRTLSAIAFFAISTSLDKASFDEIVPIVYELINGSTDRVRWGAVALIHLLKIAPELWRENLIVCENLSQMLYKELQPMREGLSLVLMGLAQTSMFHVVMNGSTCIGSFEDWINLRRKATQQWLMMLQQNSTRFSNNHLILGALYGGILPLLHEHANSPTLDGFEMGRLCLQALLPVLQQGLQADVWMGNDDEQSTLSSKDRKLLRAVIHRGALVSLSNVALAAHPIIGGHQGKILCTLVAFVRTTGLNGYLENHKLAKDVAAMVLRIGETNHIARDAVVSRIMGDYDNVVQTIMIAIKERSLLLGESHANF